MSNMVAELLVNALMAGAMVWIIGKYLDIFLEKKEWQIWAVLMWGIYFVYQFYTEFEKGEGSSIMLLLNVVLTFGISLVCYCGNIGSKLLYSVLVCVIAALIEMLTYFCLQFLLSGNAAAFNSFGSAISKILFIILIISLNMKLKKYSKRNLPGKYIAMLLLIPVASVFIAYNIFFLDNESGSIRSTLSFTLMLFINCFIFEICQKLYENMEVEHENTIFAQQLELITKHTEEQKRIFDKQKEFRHNLKNYCIGLRASIERNEKEKALEMLDKILTQEKPTGEYIVDTGNTLIDTLINYKCAIALKYGIDVIADVLVPETIPKVDCSDLSIILGNLIDNAIEAASECTYNKKIDISIGIRRGELVIDICNTYAKEPRTDKQGNFVSAKKDYENHGFGIKSVKKTVEKYDGNILFQIKKGVFEAIIIIKIDQF